MDDKSQFSADKLKVSVNENLPEGTIMLVAYPTENLRFDNMEELAQWMVENGRVSILKNVAIPETDTKP